MSSASRSPYSLTAKASWSSLALALGCICVFGFYLVIDEVSPFDKTRHGVLTGLLPRAALVAVWAGTALTALFGMASLLLIRRRDLQTNAVYGIAGRGLCGIVMGLLGVLVMWLFVGHVVIGF